jgi:hypothetical protein
MTNTIPSPAICLLVSPAIELSGTDEALVMRLKNRIWDAGHTLIHATQPSEIESQFFKHECDMLGLFLVARRSCYLTWAIAGMAEARYIPQFVVARFRLDSVNSIIQSPNRLIELPAEQPGIGPILDVQLRLFLNTLVSGPALTHSQTMIPVKDSPLPRDPIQMFTKLQVQNGSRPDAKVRCSTHEMCTLSAIGTADEQGITLRALGLRLNRSGVVNTMSLSINSLKRKGLIHYSIPGNVSQANGFVGRVLSLTSAGQSFLTDCGSSM